VKFALAKLKVAAEWHAPVRRNLAEYRWLEYVGGVAPDNVPALYGHDDGLGGFAMEFVGGSNAANWKSQLLEAPPRSQDVAATARLLGEIHASSVGEKMLASRFENTADFEALRIEPYLESLRSKHADIEGAIAAMAETLRSSRTALIHGDVSPKNIIIRADKPIVLDAECATLGDPVFDVAFCINHFLLKAVYAPRNATSFAEAALSFADEYARFICWEDRPAFDERLAALLPVLMLARVDGKSPVEYLDPAQQDHVRKISRSAIKAPADTIEPLVHSVARKTV
ncbi:MAG: aminoglycoside phosphotransferase family protein, partial [Pseudomonadota bacterium]